MVLNPDCVRDILFSIEEFTGFSKIMRYPGNYSLLEKYSEEEVMYHVSQCEMSGLLSRVDWTLSDGCQLAGLSPYGHKFLSDIRSDNVWNKTKDIAKNLGIYSIDFLKQTATSVIVELIKSQLN